MGLGGCSENIGAPLTDEGNDFLADDDALQNVETSNLSVVKQIAIISLYG